MRKIAAQILYPINSEPIYNGYVKVDDGGTVLEIGQLDKECESTEFYNGILVPGFINSHCHIELSHLQGSFEKFTGMAGFIRQINRLRNSTDESERIERAEMELNNLYDSGVSGMGDISNCDESFEFKSKSKMVTRTFLEVFGTEPGDAPEVIKGVLELEKEAKKIGIEAAPTPHSCYTMSRELLREAAREGLKSGYISYHNQESREEEELLITGTGALADEYRSRGLSTPPVTGDSALIYFIEVLKEIRPEKVDENVLLVHNTCTNRRSVREALNYFKNSFWVICPLSNIFIHRELPPLDMMIEEGATIALGTDSLSSNDNLSIADEIKTIHRYFPQIELETVLKWATINGALAIGAQDKLGSIEVGKKPGIVLIDNIDFVNLRLTEKSTSKRLV